MAFNLTAGTGLQSRSRTVSAGSQRRRMVCAILAAALLNAAPVSAQIAADVSGATVNVYNAAGDIHLRAAGDGPSRVRVELEASGPWLERRRVEIRSRIGAAMAVLAATDFDRGVAGPAVTLPITADWRFGDGLRQAEILRFSNRGSSVSAELFVSVPSGRCVVAHVFYGNLIVEGVSDNVAAQGSIELRSVYSEGGRLRILTSEDERRSVCPD